MVFCLECKEYHHHHLEILLLLEPKTNQKKIPQVKISKTRRACAFDRRKSNRIALETFCNWNGCGWDGTALNKNFQTHWFRSKRKWKKLKKPFAINSTHLVLKDKMVVLNNISSIDLIKKWNTLGILDKVKMYLFNLHTFQCFDLLFQFRDPLNGS